MEWNGMDWDEIAGRTHSSMSRRMPPWHYTSGIGALSNQLEYIFSHYTWWTKWLFQICWWWPQVTSSQRVLDLSQIFPYLSKLPTSFQCMLFDYVVMCFASLATFCLFVQNKKLHQLRMQAHLSSVRKLVTVVLSYLLSEPQVRNLQNR